MDVTNNTTASLKPITTDSRLDKTSSDDVLQIKENATASGNGSSSIVILSKDSLELSAQHQANEGSKQLEEADKKKRDGNAKNESIAATTNNPEDEEDNALKPSISDTDPTGLAAKQIRIIREQIERINDEITELNKNKPLSDEEKNKIETLNTQLATYQAALIKAMEAM